MTSGAPLRSTVAGLEFQNPVLLAAGTAGYGDELDGVVALERLGGLVTKAVSLEARDGAPPPRVAEFAGGMLNAVGLANPGVEAVCRTHLPWMAGHLRRARKIVNVVGFTVDEFASVVRRLESEIQSAAAALGTAIDAYEINVSCPNVESGGRTFGADLGCLARVIGAVRAATKRPIFVKLSPELSDIAEAARVAAGSGADGITVVNTMPGMLVDVERRRPALGFGTGGMSGPGLLPIGVLSTWKVSRAVQLPIIGLGGVGSALDALQYLLAGASLIGIGTAALKDPRCPERVVEGLAEWCSRHDVRDLNTVVGTLQFPAQS